MADRDDTPAAFASEFPAATEADWRRVVEGTLKGASFEKKLLTSTPDGIAVAPISPRSPDARPISSRRGLAPWRVATIVDHPDAAEANRLALADLEGGADQLVLAFAKSRSARGFGLADTSEANLAAALERIEMDLIRLAIDPPPFHGNLVAQNIAQLCRSRRLVPATLSIDFGIRPFAHWAEGGALPQSWAMLTMRVRETIVQLMEAGFTGPFLCADGRPFHEAGAGDAQELACLIGQATAYLRLLKKAGIEPQQAQSLISFTVAVDQDQFAGIAKLRALRRLWSGIVEASGGEPLPTQIHVETSFRMLARRDLGVNMLRSTIAALAAGLGGADSISILPHTAPLGLADDGARRLARNSSLILARESQLHRTIDPAAGAGSIEALTIAMEDKAWALFQRIEAARSGPYFAMPAALDTGLLAGEIAATREARMSAIAKRKTPLTGVSEFPDLGEASPYVLRPAPRTVPVGPFPGMRLAEPFEALRDRAEGLAPRPRVFLAPLGRLADFTPRAGFAKNAYEAGGIAVELSDGFPLAAGGTDVDELLRAFKASGATAACLVGADADYASEAVAIAQALRKAGATMLHLAGKPGELEQALNAAGISSYLQLGMDLVAFLDATLTSFEKSETGAAG
ncbi:MAG: methylmalonyl-CoA mutase [Rhizobiales bacterium]|nr:methylmalonyl-CoA mutase [Hyphomicrobiales bacterium]